MILRIIFAFIVFVHGLLQLLGFVKAWNLAPVPRLTGKTLFPVNGPLTRTLGVLWLCAFLGFSITTVAFVLQMSWWWMPAACVVVFS